MSPLSLIFIFMALRRETRESQISERYFVIYHISKVSEFIKFGAINIRKFHKKKAISRRNILLSFFARKSVPVLTMSEYPTRI